MCVYYSSNNKAINAKNSLNHSRYLSNAGNKVQSLNIFFFLKLEYTTFAFLFFFFYLLTWVHTIMRTSTLLVKEGWRTLWASVTCTAIIMYKPVTGIASCTNVCVDFMLNKSLKNKILCLPFEGWICLDFAKDKGGHLCCDSFIGTTNL